MVRSNMIRGLTVTFGLFLALIVLLADLGLADRLIWLMDKIPGQDFTGHFLLLGMLTLLVNLSLNVATFRIGSLRLLKGSVIIAIIFTLEEFSQRAIASRGFALRDLAANFLGILVFSWVSVWVHAQWTQRHDRR